MKLATFQAQDGQIRSGLVERGQITAFGGADGVREVLAGELSPHLCDESWPLDAVTLLAPVPAPETVYAIGLNYGRHVEETGSSRPDRPIVFVKVRGSITGPNGAVVCPSVVRELDYEGELVIVIGNDGKAGGYCVADDVSARDLQRKEPQWTRAKGADTFCPYGPWITTADEVANPGDLRLQTWVNGELRQDSSTSDLIFDCDEIVEFISQTCTLCPGDLILTGTPSGVGMALDPPQFLTSGDRVKVAIEGLGEIEHVIA